MPSADVVLTEDEIDDLLYSARAGEVDEFANTLAELRSRYSQADNSLIFAVAIDADSRNSPLHYAAANGHREIVKSILDISGQAGLSKHQDLIRHRNESGSTPLHYAAVNGQLDAAKLLVEALDEDTRGDVLSLVNRAGYDAAFEAENAGHDAVASYLNRHMLEGGINGQSAEQEDLAQVDEAAEASNVGGSAKGAIDAEGVEKLSIADDQTG